MNRVPLLPALLASALVSGCVITNHPVAPASPAGTALDDWVATLSAPGPIQHEPVISAWTSTGLGGLLDLDDPTAAHLEDVDTPIVLAVHVLVHPDAGVFVIDSGVDRDFAAGGNGPARGLVKLAKGRIQPVEPLADIVARQDGPLAGVLLTHLHLDHILGLPDVPAEVPIYVGEGDPSFKLGRHLPLRRTHKAVFAGQNPLQTWDFDKAQQLGPIPFAWDVVGDGSIWALSTPGHTPGNMAFLARTTEGPALFVGDNSHTIWGWEHGVAPGGFTDDHDGNIQSIAHLKAIELAVPGIRVWTGHELDGEGTGVATIADP